MVLFELLKSYKVVLRVWRDFVELQWVRRVLGLFPRELQCAALEGKL